MEPRHEPRPGGADARGRDTAAGGRDRLAFTPDVPAAGPEPDGRERTEPDRTAPSRTEPDRTARHRTEPDRTARNPAEQEQAEQGRAERDRAERDRAERARATTAEPVPGPAHVSPASAGPARPGGTAGEDSPGGDGRAAQETVSKAAGTSGPARPAPGPDGTDDTPATGPDGTDDTDARRRWREIQAGFVDDPRDAVARAHSLVDEAIGALTARQRELAGQWRDGGAGDTERLRLALRGYRSLLERLSGPATPAGRG